MKYFLDFEMTAEQVVKQIGCVNEKGEEFCVYISYNDSPISNFARQILNNIVMTPDEAFTALFDWVSNSSSPPKMYTWGGSDKGYIKNTIMYLKTQKAIFFAKYLVNGLVDYAKIFCSVFEVKFGYSLQNAIHVLDPSIKQPHNALEDAKLLRLVFLIQLMQPTIYHDFFNRSKTTKAEKFNITFSLLAQDNPNIIIRAIHPKTLQVYTFKTIKQASTFLSRQKKDKNKKYKIYADALLDAVTTGSRYCGYFWETVELSN